MSAVQDQAMLSDNFRRALRGQASSVCVVVARSADEPRGMTATAVMPLSVDPPVLAIAINRCARLNPELVQGSPFGVHLLGEHQQQLATAFAGGTPAYQRFAVGQWSVDAWGVPLLEDASASFSCFVEQRIELETHTLLVGRVREVRLTPGARPLLYAHGGFAALGEPNHPRAARL